MSKLTFITDENSAKIVKEEVYSIDTLKQIDSVTEEQRYQQIEILMIRTAQEIRLHNLLLERHSISINALSTGEREHTLTGTVQELVIELKMNLELMRNLGIDQLHLTMLLRKLIGKNDIKDNVNMRGAMQRVENMTFEKLKDVIVGREIRCSECHKIVIWERWLPYMQTVTTLPCSCGHQQRIRE